VRVPDLTFFGHESGLRHSEVAVRVPVFGARLRRRDEVRYLLRRRDVADIEHPQPGRDERARYDLRVDTGRDVAVVRRIALRRVARAGIAGGPRLGVFLWLVDLQPQQRNDARLFLVRDVDDVPRADVVCALAGHERAGRVLVELEQVRLAVACEGNRVLWDRGLVPGQPADLAHL